MEPLRQRQGDAAEQPWPGRHVPKPDRIGTVHVRLLHGVGQAAGRPKGRGVEAGQHAVGPVPAPGREVGEHEVRALVPDVVVVEAQAAELVLADVGHEHVGAPQHLDEPGPVLLEVQAHGALATIQGLEHGADPAGPPLLALVLEEEGPVRVRAVAGPAGPFHLDHLSPQVRKAPADGRHREDRGDLDDPHPAEDGGPRGSCIHGKHRPGKLARGGRVLAATTSSTVGEEVEGDESGHGEDKPGKGGGVVEHGIRYGKGVQRAAHCHTAPARRAVFPTI